MRQSIAFAALVSSVLGATPPAVAAEPANERSETPRAPVIRDPFVLFFDSGSARLSRDASRILDHAAAAYRPFTHCRLELMANADRVGSATYNLSLSKRRAETILAYLQRRGVRAEARIQYFGEERPLVETDDGVAEPKNRWASIIVECPDGPL